MKNFVVKVGKRTRRGDFQQLYSLPVSVSDGTSGSNVRDYFAKKYEGFEVIATEAKYVDMTETLSGPERRSVSMPLPAGRLINFKIKFTEDEKNIFDERRQHMIKANDLLRKLHRSIRARYENLSYTANVDSGMVLETDLDGTTCRELSIRSDSFFRVVKGAIEDGEATEKLIIERTGSGSDEDPDIPF